MLAAGRTEHTVSFANPITVLLLYWTTEVDELGRVFFWPDVYGRDDAVTEALSQKCKS